MPEDASLDDFLDADDGQEATDESGTDALETETGAGDGDESSRIDENEDESVETGDGYRDASSVETAVATHEWSPDGSECDDCGETTQRRWRDEPGFVCTDCKDW